VSSILRDAAPAGLVEAVDRHDRESSAAVARAVGGHVEDRDDGLVYVSGLPAFFANGVKSPRLDPASVEERIEHVATLLRAAGVPGQWSLGPLARPGDLDRRLMAAGLTRGEDLPWLGAGIDRLDLNGVDPPELVVRRVEDEEDHLAWLAAMVEGFSLGREITHTIDRSARAIGFDPRGPWIRFVGTVAGAVVASSGLMTFGGVAGIHNVAAVPDRRRRGFGTAMTRAAIRYGRELGYRVAVLGTSPIGRSGYERMGFDDVCVVRGYAVAAPGSPNEPGPS
jgi:ribosomal protein S18 acetylase RimI-like enzyme